MVPFSDTWDTREKIADNTIQLLYLPTIEIVADGLIKPLDQIKHKRFIDLLGLQNGSATETGNAAS